MANYMHKPFEPNLHADNLFVCYLFTLDEREKMLSKTSQIGKELTMRPHLGMKIGNRCLIYKIHEDQFSLKDPNTDVKYGLYSDEIDDIDDIDNFPNGAIEFFIVDTLNARTACEKIQTYVFGPIFSVGIVTNYDNNELERIYLQLYNELNCDNARIKFINEIADELKNSSKILKDV